MVALAATAVCMVAAPLSATARTGAPPADTARTGAPPAGTVAGSAALEVISASPWVRPVGTFEVVFDSSDLPRTATVTTTIHQRLRPGSGSLREAVEKVLDGAADNANLQAPLSVALSELATVGSATTLSIPIRPDGGDPARQLIPTPGVHPVTIVVSDSAGGVLAKAVVYLNRLPERLPTGRDGALATTNVQLLANLDSDIALGPGGGFRLPPEERVAVSAARTMLATNTDLPLTVALRPNTLLGLQRGGDPADEAFLDSLGDSAFTFSPQTYVRVDTAALIEGHRGVLQRELARGNAILAGFAGDDPTGPWMLDDSIDTSVAELMGSMGTKHFLVGRDRLGLGGDDNSTPNAEAPVTSRTFALEGVPGATVSSYDIELTRLLVEPGVAAGLRSHRVVTALMASWFDATQRGSEVFPGVSAAILLYPGTDRDVLTALVDTLAPAGPLAVAPSVVPSVDEDGDPLTARLEPRSAKADDAVLERWKATDRRIGSFDSMSPPEDPSVARWALLNDQTPGSGASAELRDSIWTHIDTAIDERLAQIQTPPPRTVVLTSRSGSIPLRFRNRGPTPLTVRMTTRSQRLAFPGGTTTEVRLEPGENRIDIPVEVRAPGSSLMRVQLSSPDGSIDIREVRVTVRSTSISGVGSALSVLSLLVLAIWWLRTVLRRRSSRPALESESGATISNEPGAGDDGN